MLWDIWSTHIVTPDFSSGLERGAAPQSIDDEKSGVTTNIAGCQVTSVSRFRTFSFSCRVFGNFTPRCVLRSRFVPSVHTPPVAARLGGDTRCGCPVLVSATSPSRSRQAKLSKAAHRPNPTTPLQRTDLERRGQENRTPCHTYKLPSSVIGNCVLVLRHGMRTSRYHATLRFLSPRALSHVSLSPRTLRSPTTDRSPSAT